jgi:hypothetical protein
MAVRVAKSKSDKAGVKDTTAYKISRQIMDHIYGEDEEMTEEDFVVLYKDFHRRGGSWQSLMDGDMRAVDVIEASLDSLVKSRDNGKIAARIASRPTGQ